ncbi:MAG: carboxypeptidase-like regulatory domain-containing protein [Bacteroidetes bacterium]|nr:carboxypeptidase-like regulatory domain-containing protein [Bacteroidota bacterium]HET6243287.1 DUF5686 family protein [Bacteroidia bacterium]
MRKIIFSLIFGFSSLVVVSQNTKVMGKVIDAETKEALPFVNLVFKGTRIGTTTDFDGKFLMETNQWTDSIMVSSVGYDPLTKPLIRNRTQTINFELKPGSVQLKEVIIKPGENPAHVLLKKVIENKQQNNRENLESFEYEVYNKVQFDLNNIPDSYKDKKIFKNFKFIFDNIDSTGEKPALPMFITETLSEMVYRKKPRALKEQIKAVKISGVKNESINQFMGDIYQNVNIYDNYILVFGKSFISPIADFGLLYYKYYLIDSTHIDDRWSYHVSFMPRRRQEPTFAGDFWVHDTTFAISRIEVSIASDANINFVNGFSAYQEFNLFDGVWMMTKDKLTVDFNMADNSMGIYGRKISSYKNFVINKPRPDSYYSGTDDVIVDADASDKANEYWMDCRHDSLQEKEKAIYQLVDSIKSVPAFKTYVDVLALIISGYHVIGKFELGPYFTTYSFNQIEGNRIRLGGRTSNSFSTRLQLEGYGAYGFLDEAFKYGAGFKYFLSKTPRQAVGGSIKYDMEQLGQSPNALRQDNILASAFRRNPFYKLILVDQYQAFYEREWFSGFSNRLTFNNRTLHPTDSISFEQNSPDATVIVPKITTSEINVYTRFAYREKFVSGEFERISLGTNYPIFQLNYALGIKGLFGGQYEYQRATFNVHNFIRTAPFGYLDYMFEAGKVWGNLPYALLELHPGNETYSYDKYSFNMMNYFEFVSDEYLSLSLEQHFGGFFLDKIPFMRKLKWREVALAKGVIGSLRDENRQQMSLPSNMQSLSKPYVETGFGVENIFKVLRIDALWRLSYLDNPDIQKWGIRGTIQFTF